MPIVSIQCDALTFEIEMTLSDGSESMKALLNRDSYGWVLYEVTKGRASDSQLRTRIGKRSKWQKALDEALVIMEDELKRRAMTAATAKAATRPADTAETHR